LPKLGKTDASWPSSATAEREVRGRVFLPDGKTPASGASLIMFTPGTQAWGRQGQTDCQGRFCFHNYWSSGETPWGLREPCESGKRWIHFSWSGSHLMAWLPSSHGAAVAALAEGKGNPGQELKIVLPPMFHLRGRVTVGGKAVQGRNGQLQLRADSEGTGPLDGIMSLQVSAEADGAFELPGLTPGTYRIQASLDGIWLSSRKRLTVGPKAAPVPPLALDIGEPGPASVLKLVDARGRPVRGVRATVARPEGPLTNLLWSEGFPSDSAGEVQLPPLEAGKHLVQVPGASRTQWLVIPPLSDPAAKRVELRVVVD
jgi:hypothetical protein